jgi:hypothetical protein
MAEQKPTSYLKGILRGINDNGERVKYHRYLTDADAAIESSVNKVIEFCRDMNAIDRRWVHEGIPLLSCITISQLFAVGGSEAQAEQIDNILRPIAALDIPGQGIEAYLEDFSELADMLKKVTLAKFKYWIAASRKKQVFLIHFIILHHTIVLLFG